MISYWPRGFCWDGFFSLPNFNRCRAPCKSFGRNREEFPVQCRRLGFPLWKGWKGSRARKMTMATRWIFCFPSSTSRQFSHFEEPPAEIEGASRNLFLIWTPWWLLQHRRVWHGMTSAARSLAALSPSPPPLYSLLDIYPPGGVICPVSFPFCLPCARLFSREDLQHIVRFQTLIFDTPSVSSSSFMPFQQLMAEDRLTAIPRLGDDFCSVSPNDDSRFHKTEVNLTVLGKKKCILPLIPFYKKNCV